MKPNARIIHGSAPEVLGGLDDDSIQCVVTSPPYFGVVRFTDDPSELGQETTSDEYVRRMVMIFAEIFRVLTPDGILWLNLGDTFNSYAGTPGPGSSKKFLRRAEKAPRRRGFPGLLDPTRKAKDLLGIPWRVALALQDRGWYLRSEIIWRKINPAPEPAAIDRPYRAHETVFILTKRERKTRAKHRHDMRRWSVWNELSNDGRSEDHPADFPISLPFMCLTSTSLEPGDCVLDPFAGSGTTLLAAANLGFDSIGIEIAEESVKIARERLAGDMFFNVETTTA